MASTGVAAMMEGISFFGLLAVTAMLVFYALEDRSPWSILAFAVACALVSLYGFLQGAWPFGVVERSGRQWQFSAGGEDQADPLLTVCSPAPLSR